MFTKIMNFLLGKSDIDDTPATTIKVLCDYVIYKHLTFSGPNRGIPLFRYRLHALVYMIYMTYLVTYKQVLFTQRFEAWRTGPHLPWIQAHFGSKRAIEGHDEPTTLPDERVQRVVDKVIAFTAHMPSMELTQLARFDGSWEETLNQPFYEGNEITPECIYSHRKVKDFWGLQ